MRASALIVIPLLLSGCNGSGGEEQSDAPKAEETAKPEATKAANGNDLIECAIGGGQWFLRECEVQKTKDDAGATVLVLHHPNGGFRRFTVVTDGRGLETTDGFEQAQTEVVDGRLGVQVGSDRYRFPATIKVNDKPQ